MMIISSFSAKIVSLERSSDDAVVMSFSPRVVKHTENLDANAICVHNFSTKIYPNLSSVGDFVINNISTALAPFSLQNESFEFKPVKGKIIRRK